MFQQSCAPPFMNKRSKLILSTTILPPFSFPSYFLCCCSSRTVSISDLQFIFAPPGLTCCLVLMSTEVNPNWTGNCLLPLQCPQTGTNQSWPNLYLSISSNSQCIVFVLGWSIAGPTSGDTHASVVDLSQITGDNNRLVPCPGHSDGSFARSTPAPHKWHRPRRRNTQ